MRAVCFENSAGSVAHCLMLPPGVCATGLAAMLGVLGRWPLGVRGTVSGMVEALGVAGGAMDGFAGTAFVLLGGDGVAGDDILRLGHLSTTNIDVRVEVGSMYKYRLVSGRM